MRAPTTPTESRLFLAKQMSEDELCADNAEHRKLHSETGRK